MITFESIRDLERAERENKKLQRIPDGFVEELKDYIAKKENVSDTSDILDLQAIKGTVARLIEIRERKIIDSALITARTGLPSENLTSGEGELFWAVVERLKRFREDFFGRATQAAPKKVMWRVTKDEEFVGPDLKEYKLKHGDIIELPAEVSDILSKNGIVEESK
jgi:DNA replication initiation complex subunit (GINS family)